MKRFYLSLAMMVMTVAAAWAQNTPVSQMEKLNRGVVAVPFSNGGTGRLVTWRILGTDDLTNTRFDVLRNGNTIAKNLKVSNYKDASGTATSTYQIVVKVNGEVVETTEPVQAWENVWLKLPLDRPAAGLTKSGETYTYTPNDCSVGDVDGDGEYEIFLKWDPSNSKDNSQSGVTGIVYIDCYKLDGTKLWRIDLGQNIRAGAHYTQFQVYDYDGDGKAELICKTAPGSRDSKGNYVNQAATDATIKAASNTKDWTSDAGRVNGGHEYLTVFNGLTGEAVHTIAYYPNRNGVAALSDAAGTKNWGDIDGKNDSGTYGNRGERYLAGTAYIDGPDKNASAIFTRGYYGYAYIYAVSFDGQKLIPRWLSSHESKTAYKLTTWDENGVATNQSFSGLKPTSGSGSGTMFANGNHNLSIVDVDFDGNDDILWGAAALKHDGTVRFGTGYGHGDAIHVGQMIPGREGYQQFQIHEEGPYYGWDLHDAATGEILYSATGSGDNGRGMAAQLSAQTTEWWFSSTNDRQQRSATTGEVISEKSSSLNFRMYWDGSVQDQLLDGNTLDKWNDSSKSFARLVTFYNLGPGSTCNSTKSTPNLSGDILGDWREELILYSVNDDEAYLGIYSTNIETKYQVPTLMHDHVYRMGICWENTAYNQPPHLGYNLAVASAPHIESSKQIDAVQNENIEVVVQARNTSALRFIRGVSPSGTSKTVIKNLGFTGTVDNDKETFTITGAPEEAGQYTLVIRLTANDGSTTVNDTIYLNVTAADGIVNVQSSGNVVKKEVYDLQGRLLPTQDVARLSRGVYLVREENAAGVVSTRKVTKK